ncbi:chemerin-like receptor 1 [Saccostrea echinata]|uniref:chemerin-like receptor 1 n=1 Tax=Saccostrea echinata TaxID=191078 RepID=UPI002A823E5A|nr:chemerin-like receptor 1 [Saccostrea echinata]
MIQNTTEIKDEAQESIDQTLSAIGFISFCENICLFVIMQRCKRLPLQIKFLILNMTASDFILGINCFILFCRPLTDYVLNKDMFCFIRQSIFWTNVIVSIFLMTILSLDRCLSLSLVMKYQSKIGMWITSLVLTVVWSLGIIFGVSRSSDVKSVPPGQCIQRDGMPTHLMYSVVSLVCFSIILSSFFVICCIVRKNVPPVVPMSNSLKENHNIIAAEVRAVVRMHVITITFLLCYVPGILCTSVTDVLPDLESTHPTFATAMKSVQVLFLINGILNPFLYVWRFKECSINAKLLLPAWGDWCQRVQMEAARERVFLYASYMESPTISNSYIKANDNGVIAEPPTKPPETLVRVPHYSNW